MARPKRSGLQLIEDGFADLSLNEQSRMLETLSQLHRWCKRERSRPTPEPYVSDGSAAGKPLPTEWLTAPDAEKQSRLSTEFRDHEA